MIRTFMLAFLLVAGTSLAIGADISGRWSADVELAGVGSGTVTFTFKQEAERLTGTYQGILGEATLAGTVKGDDVSFTINVNDPQVSGKIEYSGKIVSPTSLKGQAKYGDVGTAAWTAKKQ